MEWLDELAANWGVAPLTQAQTEALLAVSRDVAHGVERKATPLAAFLLGRAVQRTGGDEAFSARLEELRAAIGPGPVGGAG